VKEHFLVHAYNDLVAFITDFQMNRTGKPTKALQAKLNVWNPTFDLRRATNEERVNWRRYTLSIGSTTKSMYSHPLWISETQ
jgi:hypothetical protein